jgi:excisionase family DNA binding protein
MTLLRMKEASNYTGLHPNTLRKYIDQGVIKGVRLGKHRYVEKAELDRLMGITKAEPKGVAVYARVSTKKQQDAGNLDRQKKRLLAYCAANKLKVVGVLEDTASGLNENRRGLRKLFGLARRGEIDTVVVEYKDRLARFGFEYLKEALASYGVRVIAIEENESKSPNEELVEDLIAIVTSFSARLYGKLGAKKIVKTIKEECHV